MVRTKGGLDDMKDYFVNQESFDELLKLMIRYNVFTYGITKTGEKGYEYSNEFREYFLKCISKAKSINFKGSEKELFISTLMTFNEKISLELGEQMAIVIAGKNSVAEKLINEKSNQ